MTEETSIQPAPAPGLLARFIGVLTAPRATFENRGEEMIFVLKGKMELSLPNHRVTLDTGDCIMFKGYLPHRSVSVGKQQAEALVIVTSDTGGNGRVARAPAQRRARGGKR